MLTQFKSYLTDITPHLQKVYQNELFLTGLCTVVFCNQHIEKLLTTLRTEILTATLKNQIINPDSLPLLINLGIQNYLNEYVAYISNSEKEMLASITQLLDLQMQAPNWTPYDSEALLLLLAMYQCLHHLPMAKRLMEAPLELWPNHLQRTAKLSLFDIHNEIAISQRIPSLTPVHNPVSKEVQTHYEQNPYPRWSSLNAATMPNLADLILSSIPHVENDLTDAFYDEETPILIAGCGTGQQPIGMAQRFQKAKITAIDISRRSLAYATIKAGQYNLKNIEFLHGDVLEAPKHLHKFDYIECSGVLHHMESPILGWQKLLELLNPGGIMNIALYSKHARTDITSERAKIETLNLEPTAENIRLYRQALFNQEMSSPLPVITLDFYSLSECRDLLFHQHEQCFTWDDIKQHCEDLNLTFLGLLNGLGIQAEYFALYPEEDKTNCFEKLAMMEKNILVLSFLCINF